MDSIFKTLFLGEVLTGIRVLAIIHHNIFVGLKIPTSISGTVAEEKQLRENS
jgi:hypothetical protein